MSKDPNAPVTRLPNLYFTNTDNSNRGLFVPSCTAEQVAAIPRDDLSPGGLIFDTTAEELLTYTAAGFWIPILTAGSEIDLTNIVCDTLIANETIFASESVSSANINGTNITCSSLLNYESITSPLINAVDINATGNTVLKNTIVNGSLRANVIAGQSPTNDVSPLTVELDNGAGASSTAFIRGSIFSGSFTLNTGVISVTNGYIGTFTIPAELADEFSGSFSVNFMPASITTANINIYIICNKGLNPPTFLVGVLGSLNNTVQYKWNYQIIGNKKQ